MITDEDEEKPDSAMLKIPAFLRRGKPKMNTDEQAEKKEVKPRTAAQKWARLEKVRNKIEELKSEENVLLEELKTTLS